MNDLFAAIIEFGLIAMLVITVLVKVHALIDLAQYRQLADLDMANADRLEAAGCITAAESSRARAADYRNDVEQCRQRIWWPLRARSGWLP